MALEDDLRTEVASILRGTWTTRAGTVVPEPEHLKLSNDAVELRGTVLYADISESTSLVDHRSATFAAEVYKVFLHCAAKIIRAQKGTITAYDGDRIMGVFVGGWKNTNAVKAALRINFARLHIINPLITAQYRESTYELSHAAGIDTSTLLAARTGVRGANDLVWVGRAANYAAKLSSLKENSTWITRSVFNKMNQTVKVADDGMAVWTEYTWDAMDDMAIYGTDHWLAST